MIRIGCFLVMVVVSAIASANESNTLDAARACTSHQDEVARLACYDAAFGVEPSQPASQTPVPEAASQPSAQERFGMRGELARKVRPSEAEVNELRARIVAIDWLPRGEFVLTLDNGQVWSQKRKESIGPLQVGDMVTIRAGALGSFRMSASTARATQVQRTK